jgi:hypothetical protein
MGLEYAFSICPPHMHVIAVQYVNNNNELPVGKRGARQESLMVALMDSTA